MITSNIVLKLKEHVDFVPICPEVEIGLEIPRPTLRIIRTGDDDHLIQPDTGRDVNKEMNKFSQKFLDTMPEGLYSEEQVPYIRNPGCKSLSFCRKISSCWTCPGLFWEGNYEPIPVPPC